MIIYCRRRPTLRSRSGEIERYGLSVPRINWSDYFEKRRILGVIPYDAPKMRRPEEYRTFMRLALTFFFKIADPLAVYVCFSTATCDAQTMQRIQHYRAGEGLVVRQCKQCAYVRLADSAAAEAFLFSGVLKKRRAVEAFAPYQEDEEMVQCDRKAWHVREWGRIAYWALWFLDKPLMELNAHPEDVPKLDSVLEASAEFGRDVGNGEFR